MVARPDPRDLHGTPEHEREMNRALREGLRLVGDDENSEDHIPPKSAAPSEKPVVDPDDPTRTASLLLDRELTNAKKQRGVFVLEGRWCIRSPRGKWAYTDEKRATDRVRRMVRDGYVRENGATAELTDADMIGVMAVLEKRVSCDRYFAKDTFLDMVVEKKRKPRDGSE